MTQSRQMRNHEHSQYVLLLLLTHTSRYRYQPTSCLCQEDASFQYRCFINNQNPSSCQVGQSFNAMLCHLPEDLPSESRDALGQPFPEPLPLQLHQLREVCVHLFSGVEIVCLMNSSTGCSQTLHFCAQHLFVSCTLPKEEH